ncbi:MAG: hypothetical protein RLZZ504_286 [Bacteroidota bacterium]
MKRTLRVFAGVFFGLLITNLRGQIAKTQVVQVAATVNNDGTVTLKWPNDNYTGNYVIHHRDFIHANNSWKGPDATLLGSITSWTDTLSKGQSREYRVLKVKNATTEALGYIYVGNQFRPNPTRGGIVLLIDSSYIQSLKTEIATLGDDLLGDGWFPSYVVVGRNEKVDAVKTKLEAHIKRLPAPPKALYILGHVPVPYSGNFSTNGDRPPPDGHVEGVGNHTGAWPADVYYGTVNCYWGDDIVNCTTGADARHHNIPGDGKFDQSAPECPIAYEIGRADFYNMDAFSKNDTQLTREYLNRVHDYKLGKTQFRRRGLIDNNFTGLNLASTGYHNLPCFVGLDSFSDAVDYFTEQTAGSYLWSYGCGAGSYGSCSGIGTTNDFVANNGKFSNAFTMLAGSYFGDWDSKNNILRGALAGGSLASCWGGIPKWYLHHMGLGQNIGYGAKITQNNVNDYFNGAFNFSWNGVFIALMGDPTLNMLYVKPPSRLTATESNGGTLLKWNRSPEKVDGYVVYRIDQNTQEYKEIASFCGLGSAVTTDTTYFDYCKPTPLNPNAGNYKYAVRAFKWETTGSGSYQNLSLATTANTKYTLDLGDTPPVGAVLYPNPCKGSTVMSHLPVNAAIQVRIYNAVGQLMQSTVAMTDANGQYKLVLKSGSTGIFNVVVTTENFDFSGQFIVVE